MAFELTDKNIISNVISDIYSKFNKNRGKTPQVLFDIKDGLRIIEKVIPILQNQPSVLNFNIEDENKIHVIGDIHGNLESLIAIFRQFGSPETAKYLFLGDYVDRGRNSSEVMIILYAYKILYPNNIFLMRGNHEFVNMTDHYGFKEECYKRIKIVINGKIKSAGPFFYSQIVKTFEYLSILAIINGETLCVHGGISALIKNRDELMKIKKVGSDFTMESSAQAELLWNDPNNDISSYEASPRGIGCTFGEYALETFLKNMQLKRVIRAHQNEFNGFNWPFGEDGGILTVFSSVDYCGTFNEGAVAVVSGNGEIETQHIIIKKLVFPPPEIVKNNFVFLDDIRSPSLNIDNIPRLVEY